MPLVHPSALRAIRDSALRRGRRRVANAPPVHRRVNVRVVAGNHERILPDGIKRLGVLRARLSPRFFDVGSPRGANCSLLDCFTNGFEGLKSIGNGAHIGDEHVRECTARFDVLSGVFSLLATEVGLELLHSVEVDALRATNDGDALSFFASSNAKLRAANKLPAHPKSTTYSVQLGTRLTIRMVQFSFDLNPFTPVRRTT